MAPADRTIRTTADARAIRGDVESVYDGWFGGSDRIEWEEFLDRLERYGYDLGDSMESPAIREVKRIVRELREAAS